MDFGACNSYIRINNGDALPDSSGLISESTTKSTCKSVSIPKYDPTALFNDVQDDRATPRTNQNKILTGNVPTFINIYVSPLLSLSLPQKAFLIDLHRPAQIHPQINTGMNYLGLQPDQYSIHYKDPSFSPSAHPVLMQPY